MTFCGLCVVIVAGVYIGAAVMIGKLGGCFAAASWCATRVQCSVLDLKIPVYSH